MRHVVPRIIVAVCVSGILVCCPQDDGPESYVYRQRMREFVEHLSAYAKGQSAGFIVIPQNGLELVAQDTTEESENALAPEATYLATIDGVGREDLFYGYDADNEPTPQEDTNSFLEYLDLAEANGVQVLVTDYCRSHERMDRSYTTNGKRGFISFAADHRELDNIPAYPLVPYLENADSISTLAEAHNFLYLINPGEFESRQEYLNALASSRYDLIIMDLFYEESAITLDEVNRLRQKPQGGARLVIAYMSIGEAEDYRYYWQPSWKPGAPEWLETENPDWRGNFVVRYWEPGWQSVIYGSPNAYLDRVLGAGFDGVYLDIIDAFEYFENRD